MEPLKRATLTAAVLCAITLVSCAPWGSAVKEDGRPADPVMGDWVGHRVTARGEVLPVTVQAIALGNKSYRLLVHGLPGRTVRQEDSLEATLEGTRLIFPAHALWDAVCDNSSLLLRPGVGEPPMMSLVRSRHASPALGAQPPRGAIWLFDGTNLDGWRHRDPAQSHLPVGWKAANGALEVVPGTGDIITRRTFRNFQLHLEFRTPFMPEAREQARGNSGVYLQGRYEVQVLDSYGLRGEDNECGGIYRVAAPRVNMCAPPGEWQSYDVTFHAPRFDSGGNKISDAVITVLHNGVVIHEDLVIPGPTGGAIDDDVRQPGGILLQDHGNLVQYRNIWLVELTE